MKRLAIVSVLALLTAGLLIHPRSTPQQPAGAAPIPERAEWRNSSTKHWRAIILRKE